MEKPFKITFPNQLTARAIQVNSTVTLSDALHELGFHHRHHRVLVVIGGASKLSVEDFARVRLLFVKVLAPLAEKWGAFVVDGGTDVGVMRLMGQARAELGATFPLIGVSPVGLAVLPNQVVFAEKAAPLEPHHTHFVLVPGSTWGDESSWIADIASELADGAPSVTVLINGGEVTWQDALQNIQAGRSLVVIEGSGRTADLLAAVLRGEAIDERAETLVASGLVQAIDLEAGLEALTQIIEEIFSTEK